MRTLRQMKSDGWVVKIAPEVWGVLMVIAGTIAAFVVLAITRH
jgi:hypothetical protein